MKEMKELKADIKLAVDRELIRANGVHVPKFVDESHRFGVLYGEYKEALNEAEKLKISFSAYEWNELQRRSIPDVVEVIDEMRKDALNLAAEATQFVAMCEKALAGIYEDMKIAGELND